MGQLTRFFNGEGLIPLPEFKKESPVSVQVKTVVAEAKGIPLDKVTDRMSLGEEVAYIVPQLSMGYRMGVRASANTTVGELVTFCRGSLQKK